MGCVELLNTVQRRVRPKLHVFGGIHEGKTRRGAPAAWACLWSPPGALAELGTREHGAPTALPAAPAQGDLGGASHAWCGRCSLLSGRAGARWGPHCGGAPEAPGQLWKLRL